jgi:hypothetical protein
MRSIQDAENGSHLALASRADAKTTASSVLQFIKKLTPEHMQAYFYSCISPSPRSFLTRSLPSKFQYLGNIPSGALIHIPRRSRVLRPPKAGRKVPMDASHPLALFLWFNRPRTPSSRLSLIKQRFPANLPCLSPCDRCLHSNGFRTRIPPNRVAKDFTARHKS